MMKQKIKYNRYLKKEPMTTIIGIRCQDGVVLASDSQSSFYRGVQVKRLNVNKINILPTHNIAAVAGAGDSNQVKKVTDMVSYGLNQQFQQNLEDKQNHPGLTQDEVENVLEKCMMYLHKRYNIEKSTELGYSDVATFFDPICIYCSRIDYVSEDSGETTPSYLMYLLHTKEADIESINDYATIGSGAVFAEYLLGNLYRQNLTINEACMIAPYVIQEVMKINPDTGGMTSVAILKNEGGFQTLTQEQITIFTNKVRPSLDHLGSYIIPKIIRGEIDVDKFKDL